MTTSIAFKQLVGRDKEFDQLSVYLSRNNIGKGQIVVLAGEAGMGKSTLISNLSENASRAKQKLFFCQAEANQQGTPFSAFTGVINQLSNELKNDTKLRFKLSNILADRWQVLCQLFPQLKENEAIHFDQNTINLSTLDSEERAARACSSLLSLLGDPQNPALVIIEDYHWVDRSTALSIKYWHQSSKGQNSYVSTLLSSRLDSLNTLEYIEDKSAFINLSPLKSHDSSIILKNLAGEISNQAISFISNLSAGNPFMLSAIYSGLLESGSLIKIDGQVTLSEDSHSTITSENVSADRFLAKRIQSTPPELRALLEAIAVYGRGITIESLSYILDYPTEQVSKLIEQAITRQLIKSDHNLIIFTHAKFREIVTSLSETTTLVALHAKSAQYLIDNKSEDNFAITNHLILSNQEHKSFEFALNAAEQALQRSFEDALRYYKIAKSGMHTQSIQMQYKVSLGLGTAFVATGHYQEAETELRCALSLSKDVISQAKIYVIIAELMLRSINVKSGLSAIEEGLKLLDAPLPREGKNIIFKLLLSLSRHIIQACFPTWFIPKVKNTVDEKSNIIEELYGYYQHFAYFDLKMLDMIVVHLEQINRLECKEPCSMLSGSYVAQEVIWSSVPWFSRALYYVDKAINTAKLVKDIKWHSMSLITKGSCLFMASRFHEGLFTLKEAEEIAEKSGDLWKLNLARCNIAYCYYRLGETDLAIQVAKLTWNSAFSSKDYISASCALSVWAKASDTGIPDETIEKANSVLDKVDLQSKCEFLQAIAINQIKAGNIEQAANILESICDEIKDSPFKNEYVMSAVPWYLTTLRILLENEPDSINKKQIQTKAKSLIKSNLAWAKKFRNNLPHLYREIAHLEFLNGESARCLKLISNSIFEADKQEADLEKRLSEKFLSSISSQ